MFQQMNGSVLDEIFPERLLQQIAYHQILLFNKS